jgi:hypothetical protein
MKTGKPRRRNKPAKREVRPRSEKRHDGMHRRQQKKITW